MLMNSSTDPRHADLRAQRLSRGQARPFRLLRRDRRADPARRAALLVVDRQEAYASAAHRHAAAARRRLKLLVRTLRFALLTSIGTALAGCVGPGDTAPSSAPTPSPVAVVQPIRTPPKPTPAPSPTGPTTFVYSGELTQGGWLRGQAPAGTVTARLGDENLELDADRPLLRRLRPRRGADGDADGHARRRAHGQRARSRSARATGISSTSMSRARQGGTTEEFWTIREPELAQIAAARAEDHDIGGWRQDFIWPVKGRISGRFGSQRIYRGGEAGSYHSGLDIATGESGTPYVAPADGVVVLAAQTPFSLEGNLLIIDHGDGLNSAFLHSSKLAVKVGDVVRQGQYLGNIGMTRAGDRAASALDAQMARRAAGSAAVRRARRLSRESSKHKVSAPSTCGAILQRILRLHLKHCCKNRGIRRFLGGVGRLKAPCGNLVTAENQCPRRRTRALTRAPKFSHCTASFSDWDSRARSARMGPARPLFGNAQGIVAVPAAAFGKKGLEREIIPQEIGSVRR